jgi:hypothetical protein
MTPVAVGQAAAQTQAPYAANTTDEDGKALFPNMFAKDSPWTVGLTTKPPARTPVEMPRSAQPVYVVLAPQASAETIESYYAPTPQDLQTEASRKSSRRAPKKKASSDELPRAKTAESEPVDRPPQPSRAERARMAYERAADERARAADESVSPLEKPLRAIGELTKLPKFITGESRDASAAPRPPKFRERYRATVARQADPHRKTNREIEAEQLEDEDRRESESDVAPDVSVELSSKQRQRDDEESRDEPNPRKHRETARRSNNKPTAREELDQLYRSAVAGREEAEIETPADDDGIVEPKVSVDAEARHEHAARPANVPVIAIDESAAPQPAGPEATRIRKSDGSSVTVYHVGAAARAATGEQDAAAGNTARSASRSSGRRQVVRESRNDTATARSNPLR